MFTMALVFDDAPVRRPARDAGGRRRFPMIEPVRRDVTVAAGLEETFRLFTEDMAAWWPLETHSMAADREDGTSVAQLVFEPRLGGRLYEIADDGTEGTWGRVLVWEPPHRLVLAWKPNLRDEPETEVEVTFAAVDAGTRVALEHRGWDLLGERADEAATGYRVGWAFILGERFAEIVGVAGDAPAR
jgi:uncharacterized protein YndB with AHSA1/START domain